VLLCTRGDFVGTEPAAVALATSSYEPPEALLAIGLDQSLQDRSHPFIERTRVSIGFDDAANYGIGLDSEDDVLFWWGCGAFLDQTIESTKRVVPAHPNLALSDPFCLLYALSKLNWLRRFGADLISAAADASALPLPLNLVAAAFHGKNIIDGIVDLFRDLWDAVKDAVNAVEKFFGIGGDGPPKIPNSAIKDMLERVLVTFNQGSVLSRANIVAYSNGDALLSRPLSRLLRVRGSTALSHPGVSVGRELTDCR